MKQQEIVRQAVAHFQEAMDTRTKMAVRIGRRVTFIIRTSAIAFTLVACVMLFLITVIFTTTQNVIETIVTMNRHFDQMTQDMRIMHKKMVQMEGHLQSMPLITTEIGAMNVSMANIQQRTGRMSDNMVLMEEGVYRIGGDTYQIKQSFEQMDYEMSEMDYEMNQISRPMRSFNDFFPFVP